MKKITAKITAFAAILLIAALFERCTTPEVEDSQFGKVQFRIGSPGDHDSGTTSFSGEIPPGSVAQITIQTNDGQNVIVDRQIKILSTESGYITEPIDLPLGHYTIANFSIANQDSEGLYAIPEMGSAEDATGTMHAFTLSAVSGGNAFVPVNVFACRGNHFGTSLVKEFIAPFNRSYKLFYNKKGAVDSIVSTEGGSAVNTYIVHYTGDRIDSVGNYSYGQYVSVNTDFKYDEKGRIISFSYHDRYFGYEYPATSVTYDKKGRITAIGGESFAYDNHDNVIQRNSDNTTFTYTYDKGKNPFYQIKNLFVIGVEESFLGEWPLSKNNSTSMTDVNGNWTHFSDNVYDSHGRLISSDGTLFSYY